MKAARLIRAIDNGFHHISDKEASRLCKGTPLGRLPRNGYALDNVALGCGLSGSIQRTSVTGRTWSPKRGWVWAVCNIQRTHQSTNAFV